MPPIKKSLDSGPWANAPMLITTYACQKCGHWNNLKRRKGWKRVDGLGGTTEERGT